MVKGGNSARGICRSMTRPGAEKAAYLCKKSSILCCKMEEFWEVGCNRMTALRCIQRALYYVLTKIFFKSRELPEVCSKYFTVRARKGAESFHQVHTTSTACIKILYSPRKCRFRLKILWWDAYDRRHWFKRCTFDSCRRRLESQGRTQALQRVIAGSGDKSPLLTGSRNKIPERSLRTSSHPNVMMFC